MRYKSAGRRQGGFNLIENLVTLFVLTVGLLGVAGMQAVAMKTQQTSHYYGKALSLAQGMADRMRSNPEGAGAGYYNQRNDTVAANIMQHATCLTTGCTPWEMAGNDMYEWYQAVLRSLPKGDAYLCWDSTPSQDPADYVGNPYSVVPYTCDSEGDTYVIHIFWDMDPERDGTLALTSDPQQSDGHLLLVFEP